MDVYIYIYIYNVDMMNFFLFIEFFMFIDLFCPCMYVCIGGWIDVFRKCSYVE